MSGFLTTPSGPRKRRVECLQNSQCADASPATTYQIPQFWFNSFRWLSPEHECFVIEDDSTSRAVELPLGAPCDEERGRVRLFEERDVEVAEYARSLVVSMESEDE